MTHVTYCPMPDTAASIIGTNRGIGLAFAKGNEAEYGHPQVFAATSSTKLLPGSGVVSDAGLTRESMRHTRATPMGIAQKSDRHTALAARLGSNLRLRASAFFASGLVAERKVAARGLR